MKEFSKPPLSYESQVALLKERGLTISDDHKAISYLKEVAYYRLSAYYIPYENKRHVFIPDTKFENIVELYEFDHRLRHLLDNALETIELYLRAQISNIMAMQHGPFAHENTSFFSNPEKYQKWISKIHDEVTQSKEIFIEHYQTKYDGFPRIPIWMAIEIISFGSLSHFYKNLYKNHQKAISEEIGIAYPVLENWMHFFNYIRNICAHHARLWNRTFAICPTVPRDLPQNLRLRNNKLAFAMVVIDSILLKMPKGKEYSTKWRSDVYSLLKTPPPVPHFYQSIGLESSDHFLKIFNNQ